MIREHFHNEIKKLEQELLVMSNRVIEAILSSSKALQNRDDDLAKKIVSDDKAINKLRWEIEEKCAHLIATQQPMAIDLREIIAFLDIVTNLERMADHAKGIANLVLLHSDMPLMESLQYVPEMTEKVSTMVEKSLDAFIHRDARAARKIRKLDNEVDDFNDKLCKLILERMAGDKNAVQRGTHLIWVSHNLERIADRATNICERILLLVEGYKE